MKTSNPFALMYSATRHHLSPAARPGAFLLLFFAAALSTARAETVTATVMADFNGYNQGALWNGTSSTQPGGIDVGFTTSATNWQANTGAVQVVPGALSLAYPSAYAITQQSAASSMVVRARNGSAAADPRQNYRALAAPMTGVVWGSFLAQQSTTTNDEGTYQATGLTFNATSINPNSAPGNTQRLYAVGAALTVGNTGTVPGLFTAGQTSLVLFRHDTGSRQLDVWVDPALPAHPALLSSASADWSGTYNLFGASGSLTAIGVGGNYAVGVGTDSINTTWVRSGDLDAIRLDNTADGYFAVTGINKFTPVDMADAPVVSDFNDTITRNNLTVAANYGLGTGYSGEWLGGSAVLQVANMDLVAPATTRYAITQAAGAGPGAVWGSNASYAVVRMLHRLLAAPLSGTVWGSFLVNNGNAQHRTGVNFNNAVGIGVNDGDLDPAYNKRWLYAHGTSLIVRSSSGEAVATVPGVLTLGQTALVLFSYDTAAQRLRVWVDPVLTDNVEGMAAVAPAYDSGAGAPLDFFGGDFSGALGRIGIIVNGGQTAAANAGKLDSVRFASGAAGYYAVTGLLAKPLILAQPQSQTLATSGTATFTVSATSQWPLLYQWTHGGTAIASATTATLGIPNIQDGDAGSYQVVVAHDGGIGSTVSDAAVLTVGTPAPLVINSGPDLLPSGTVGAGTAVSMVISASGNEPLVYQWLKSGTAIASATSATYSIGSATVADAGSYSVVVDDPVNAPLYSGTVTLAVVGPPVITTQPSGTSVLKGGSATFTAAATCASPMDWQWYHGGAEIPGATSATYTISSVDLPDAGGYSVRVSNAELPSYYVTSAQAVLDVRLVDVLNAPVVADFNDCVVGGLNNAGNAGTGTGFGETGWPAGTGVVLTKALDLTAPASTRYGFTQSGNPRSVTAGSTANVLRQNSRLLATPLSGLVWGSFLVENRTAENITGLTFNYASNSTTPVARCRLGAEGTSLVVYSRTTDQGVSVPNVFTLGQTSLVLFAYDTVTMNLRVWVDPVLPDIAADIDTLTPALEATMDILTNGTLTGSLSRIGVMARSGPSPIIDAESGFLDSLRLAGGEDGYYRVTGIAIAPVILTQPVTQVKAKGDPVTFAVSATGLGTLAFQWLHSGSVIPLATGSSFTIPATVPDDRGWYEVMVSHAAGAGSVMSAPGALIFADEAVPLAVTSLQLIPSSTVHTGTAVSMMVSGTGTEPITYQWLKSGSVITGATSGTFTIDPVVPADSGGYSVQLNDLAGNPVVSGTLELAVLGPPVILEQPASQVIAGSGSAGFFVSATSVSPMAYQWYRDGAEIPGATGAAHNIPHAQVGDAGGYSVKVTNTDYPSQYFTVSATATLTVIPIDTREAPVVADFNDYLVGALNGASNDGKGVGFGEDRWSTTTAAVIVAEGDLFAPAFTRYGIVQPAATPRSLWL
ncbi:MAG: immunoglobulin domain-containing protein, partial [Opitutaceae bacterium]|nr:immunoglobulin domain-containing protein [Opitutaceae bacterium]